MILKNLLDLQVTSFTASQHYEYCLCWLQDLKDLAEALSLQQTILQQSKARESEFLLRLYNFNV